MILIGQFDSPFVRRVGIALQLYGMAFTQRPLSAFGDAAAVAAFNPLRRVPILVLDGGEVLVESSAILDHLDQEVGPERAMVPRTGPARRHALQACALAMGAADKAVALVYERVLHPTPSTAWMARCAQQIGDTLALIEARGMARTDGLGEGEGVTHADIALGCALRFLAEAHPALWDPHRWPALAAHAAWCEAMPAFTAIQQTFVPPAGAGSA